MITAEECKAIVAKKYNLGTTLVMGHKATYWDEAMNEYAEQARQDERVKVLNELFYMENPNKMQYEVRWQLEQLKEIARRNIL